MVRIGFGLVAALAFGACSNDVIVPLELPQAQATQASTQASASDPLRWPAVQPIFEAKCDKCHNKGVSDNVAAMKVFESSSYPFSTEVPEKLLVGLEHMFEKRGDLTADEKKLGLEWLRGGALDAAGKPPQWREP